jgi:protein-S-isoprenylcysteine O-methyltransferase Ste14
MKSVHGGDMIALKTLVFTVVAPGVLIVLIPFLLAYSNVARFPVEADSLRYLGWLLVSLGAAIYFWCAFDFTFLGEGTPAPNAPPKNLVIRGLYKFVRNPMYTGALLILLGESVLFGSVLVLGYAVLRMVLWHRFVVVYEEPRLHARFGASYERYRRSVPRWLPRLNRGQRMIADG